MRIGFFLVLQSNLQDYLHAASLVREAQHVMPDVELVQLSDLKTPAVPGVSRVQRLDSQRPLLEQRLTHYAQCDGEWLFLDTDVSIRQDVGWIFNSQFDVALCDRHWPHVPQDERTMHTMPFNTGVVFSRSQYFWLDVLQLWRAYTPAAQDWMSEQRAVYQVVRSGRYYVQILEGMAFNYPPSHAEDAPDGTYLVHYKGPRKAWLSAHATKVLSQPVHQLVGA